MKLKKEKMLDYFVLCARVLIAWTFLSYGWGKFTGSQFGLKPEQMNLPLKDIGLFKLSWYLFDQEPFKSFIGISQILAGILLLYNRTVLIGALLSLPILTNILIIDITFIKMPGFYWRLSYYLFLDLLILWHYRERAITAFRAIFDGMSTKFKYPIWAYLILPFMAIGLELIGIVPKLLTGLIIHPQETLSELGRIPEFISSVFSKIFS